MSDFLMWAGGVIMSGLFGLIGWVLNMIFGKIKEQSDKFDILENRFDAHRLYAAETYTTKKDIKDMRDQIVSQLVRIEDKMDKKADRH